MTPTPIEVKALNLDVADIEVEKYKPWTNAKKDEIEEETEEENGDDEQQNDDDEDNGEEGDEGEESGNDYEEDNDDEDKDAGEGKGIVKKGDDGKGDEGQHAGISFVTHTSWHIFRSQNMFVILIQLKYIMIHSFNIF